MAESNQKLNGLKPVAVCHQSCSAIRFGWRRGIFQGGAKAAFFLIHSPVNPPVHFQQLHAGRHETKKATLAGG
jgi:hypothetical protein